MESRANKRTLGPVGRQTPGYMSIAAACMVVQRKSYNCVCDILKMQVRVMIISVFPVNISPIPLQDGSIHTYTKMPMPSCRGPTILCKLFWGKTNKIKMKNNNEKTDTVGLSVHLKRAYRGT